jgi:hypothetical protein
MTVRLADDGTIFLEGRCPTEDSETLVRLLAINPAALVDWCLCEHAHTAVVQILLAVRPAMRGPPPGLMLSEWIQPMLAGPDR